MWTEGLSTLRALVLERDVKDLKRVLTEQEVQEFDRDIAMLKHYRSKKKELENKMRFLEKNRLMGSSSIVTSSNSGSGGSSSSGANKGLGKGRLHYQNRGGVRLFEDYKSESKINSDMSDAVAIQM